jgi:hypothetical protein
MQVEAVIANWRRGSDTAMLELRYTNINIRTGLRMSRAEEQRGSLSRKPAGWTFLSNHAHVLVSLARDPEARLRDVAEAVGITERAVQGIVADLAAAGVLVKHRRGRRNRYEIDRSVPLRHPLEAHADVGMLLRLLRSP